ncbi:unnamed protein product [Miscanthus lutarioriparius]|uniref:GDP-L-galactose phosphorylase n=1 Tax=Miscanthus lutarioriparius TaxID=422564 RepID=A0A811RAB9_9POAL|nr:unnamed protein product [Miscanthus lutarioriparius]
MVSATKVEGEYSFLRKDSHLDQSEGVKIHLYRFGAEHRNDKLESLACFEQDGPSLLDNHPSCSGGRNFVDQLNNKWDSFSLKEYDKFFESFACLKPNSMKSYDGLLLGISQGENDRPEVVSSVSLPKDGLLVIANAYPVEYGHIFLVPSAINQLSCYWDKRMIGLATKISSEVNNAAFRVFFDNGTSIVSGHMIFQACYFAIPLPVESASTFTVKNLVTGCCLSAWECGGYFVYHTKFGFDNASETEISNRMGSVSLEDSTFEDLKHLCCAIADDLVM